MANRGRRMGRIRGLVISMANTQKPNDSLDTPNRILILEAPLGCSAQNECNQP